MSVLAELNFKKEKLPKRLQLKINTQMTHYPNNPHTQYHQWNWCKDEFVPPLSEEEFQLYIKSAEKFRTDFLDNLNAYLDFCSELSKPLTKIASLSQEKQLAALVAMFFLFMSAMDHHYYHFDYYLDLEEYPKSPLGWHFLRMRRILEKLSKRMGILSNKHWVETQSLHLLTKKGEEVIESLKSELKKSELQDLIESFQAIQIFIQVQQEEEKLFNGNNYNSPVFTTGLAIWKTLGTKVWEADDRNFVDKISLTKILSGDPIWGTRKILIDRKYFFAKPILKLVDDEVRRWV